MQQVQIDVIDLQAPQTSCARLERSLTAGVVRQHLAHDKHLIAAACDGFTDKFLRPALAVQFRGVEQRHS